MQELVIDWEQAITLAGNNREFAKEMFALLVKELTSELIEIKKEHAIYDTKALRNRLHRLYGALCYCGAPRLKTTVAAFLQALNNKQYLEVPALLVQLELEINELIKQVASFQHESN